MSSWGVIFDWDGVIVDSSRLHEKSWDLLSQELHLPLPAGHFKQGFGRKNEYIIPNILKWETDPDKIKALAYRKESLYRDLVQQESIELLPGVRQLLDSLQRNNILKAIGSSTCLANIQVVLDATGIVSYFDTIVSAEQVTQGKPNPEVFLKAAQHLNLPPKQCLVIEDAYVGLEAAKTADMFALGVATTNELENLKKEADWAVNSLAEVTVEQLEQWVKSVL